MIEDLFRETEHKMERSIAALRKDLSRIRTGRASLAFLRVLPSMRMARPLHSINYRRWQHQKVVC